MRTQLAREGASRCCYASVGESEGGPRFGCRHSLICSGCTSRFAVEETSFSRETPEDEIGPRNGWKATDVVTALCGQAGQTATNRCADGSFCRSSMAQW